MRIIIFIIIGSFFSSCISSKKEKKDIDFSFYLPDENLYVTTSKQSGGDFYVMFSKTDSISRITDSTDYIKCDIEDAVLVIVIDPNHKNDLHFMYPYIKKVNENHLNLVKLEPDDFTNRFYHQGTRTNPDTLRNPYKKLLIAPMSYNIVLQRDSTFDSQIRIKKGNMWGE